MTQEEHSNYAMQLRDLSLPELEARVKESRELVAAMRPWSPYYPMALAMDRIARDVLYERKKEAPQ